MSQACKNHIIWLADSAKILDFHHLIFLRQDRSGKWLSLLSSVVKFGKILPIRSTHFGFFVDFHWDMSGNWINIYNLHYNTVVLKKKKKIAKTFKNCSFSWAKTRPVEEAMPKIKFNFFGDNKRKSWAFKNFLCYQNISFDNVNLGFNVKIQLLISFHQIFLII